MEKTEGLITAAHNGDTGLLRTLLEVDASLVHAVDVEGRTGATNAGCSALFIGARAGHSAAVEILLAAGASVDLAKRPGLTSLYIASQSGHTAVVELLLAAGAAVDLARDNGVTPLLIASQLGHTAVVELLLAAGAAVDLAHVNGATPLWIASQEGYSAVVQLLLAAGAAVDLSRDGGATPLMMASHEGRTAVVELLLAAGAAVDLARDNGVTPLLIASHNGHKALVEVILAGGAAVDVGDVDGVTPLLIASQKGHTAVVELLLAAGAAVDLARDGGVTPLFVASQEGHAPVVKQLLAAGASANVIVDGITPLMIAQHLNHTAVVELLEVWPVLSPLMVATVMRRDSTVWQLLHSGEDPTVTVQHQQHHLSALVLATNDEAACSWAAPVCTKTLHLIEQSLQWSPYDLKAHQLFPPPFRRGVQHVLGLALALDRVGRGLPQYVWMLIISCLPREWELKADLSLPHEHIITVVSQGEIGYKGSVADPPHQHDGGFKKRKVE